MFQYVTALVSSHVEAWAATLDREEEGQGLVEYALILVLISVVAIVTMQLVDTKVTAVFQKIADSLNIA